MSDASVEVQSVAVERAGIVLAHHRHPVRDLMAVAAHIRLVAELHEAVHVVPGQAQDAARAVVFERARQHRAAAGGKRAGDGVAGKRRVPLALEAEGQALGAVDEEPAA